MTAVTLSSRSLTVGAEGQISGGVLRTFRRHLGLTQNEIAEKLLVDINTYRSWEHGRRPLGNIPAQRLCALSRSLVKLGIPAAVVGALGIAIEVDLDVARALASKENLFPPDGCSETWQALLWWALAGTTPPMFMTFDGVEPPRICLRDRLILVDRCGWELGG